MSELYYFIERKKEYERKETENVKDKKRKRRKKKREKTRKNRKEKTCCHYLPNSLLIFVNFF